jgi:F0F1-type ATP synthase membrane subunit b/b'
MAWFKSSNNKRDDKTTVLENRMNNYEAVRATQATQLAVLETCQQNIQDKLGEIKEDIANSAQAGAHSVNQQLAFMLTEVQKIVSHNNKRGHE